MVEYVLQMKDINKSFWNVHVLQDVRFNLKPGEVHALLGENGAGKSTLIKILGGIYSKDSGSIVINGREADINNPNDARDNEISILHQEICIVPTMTVAENIFLGTFPLKGPLKLVDYQTMNLNTQATLDSLNMNIKATDMVGRLSVAQQQMVEIARAISFNTKIIVMDEPTSSLTDNEVEGLMRQIYLLKERGVSIIYISHRLEEIFQICDRVTVMRDGRYIGTENVADISRADLIRMMVGRELTQMFSGKHIAGSGEVLLKAENLQNKYLKGVSFELRKGEILGFAGLVGAGRTELSRALFGIDPIRGGILYIDGEKKHFKKPMDAMRQHIGLVPEDRKKHGLILQQSVSFNLTLAVARTFIRFFRADKKKELSIINKYKDTLSIKMSGVEQLCKNLSGGNQQKVVISKWLATNPRILILDEPTRGIDVGAKAEIYRLITQLAESGISIIMISSELPEILNLSSRIAVMYEGKLMTILDAVAGDISQEQVMHYAMGGQ